MRIWLDPSALKSRGLTTTEVVDAIREQNVQVAAGTRLRATTAACSTLSMLFCTQWCDLM